MRRLATVTLVFLAAGCAVAPISRQSTNNYEIQVERLFDHDGCTVYRFYDGGSARYFTKCGPTASNVSWRESCGKNCVRSQEITTANLEHGI